MIATTVVPHFVLDEVREHLEDFGVAGAEATGMLVAGPDRIVRHAVFPDQRAGHSPGSSMQVTEQGKLDLALALAPDETYVARIHSHPGCALHRSLDDRVPALCFEGALSIVVPYFGLGLRAGLHVCAVFVRRRQRWCEVPPGHQRDEVLRVAS